MSSMSEASIPFQPANHQPSKAWPLSNLSSSNAESGTETCCSLPRVSVKRKSTNLTSSSLTSCMTSATVLLISSSPLIGSALLRLGPASAGGTMLMPKDPTYASDRRLLEHLSCQAFTPFARGLFYKCLLRGRARPALERRLAPRRAPPAPIFQRAHHDSANSARNRQNPPPVVHSAVFCTV